MHHPACMPPSRAPGPTRGLKYSRCACCVGCVTVITHAHRWTFFRSCRARFKKRPGPILSAPKLCLRVCFLYPTCIPIDKSKNRQFRQDSHSCIYIHIFIHVYICIYMHMYTRKCVYVYMCVRVCIYVFIYICIHTRIHINVFTCKCTVCLEDITTDMGIYLYVYIYSYIFASVCVYMYTHVNVYYV